ncbi:hypothetical protein MSAS_12100 [Mycobacterium saskatchewanense]|uniref:Oxidoreductase n=1 Tax=Mycobacterium saskatchewanense TaxID=220927 RepID=A0AAJ3NRF9_9MYCO|nr:SDR family NAD(P)-dependent oxidoreductase [Mycobacterium saskatchewanense]ORW71865.1 hypothetical protein AWC23_12325 [Mycobacterium saskatchewanense]BBX62036.1 hypothetical protein MSAS_12100 [Mycobacterium saskatchewanense]
MSRITTPFGFASTALEIADGVDLSGRQAIVTGTSSGIGAETARALAAAGAWVVLAVRDVGTGRRAAVDIATTTGSQHVTVAPMDLTDLDSVADFVADWSEPQHISATSPLLDGIGRRYCVGGNAARLWSIPDALVSQVSSTPAGMR